MRWPRQPTRQAARFDFFERNLAEGTSAATEKMGFGTSLWAARPSSYIDDRPDGRGMTACGSFETFRDVHFVAAPAGDDL
jgi:hypothetical protein